MGLEKRGKVSWARPTGLRLFAGVVVILIAVAVGVGLYLAGSPGKERSRQFDAQRLSSLQQIAGAVDAYYARTAKLPENLDILLAAAGKEGYLAGVSLTDPLTQGTYEYSVLNETSYELCADFEQPSETTDRASTAPTPAAPVTPGPGVKTGSVRSWEHGSGHACFSLNATDRLGSVLCGLTNPCQAGQTCAALPANKGTVCVPQGLECEAAGCPGRCQLLESYPVQVVCEATDKEATTCQLLKNAKTGTVGCFGCANGTCTKAPTGWEAFESPTANGGIGIPYSCFAGAKGCELAQ